MKWQLGRVALYLGLGLAAWFWLSQLENRSQNENDRALERQVEHVLRSHDAYAARLDSAVLQSKVAITAARTATQLAAQEHARADVAESRARELLAGGDTSGAWASMDSAITALHRTVNLYSGALQNCDSAYQRVHAAVVYCKARNDTLMDMLAATRKVLERQHTIRIGFLKLPKPKKWQVGLLGATLGALIDTEDRLRGLSLGGFGAVLLAPTQ